MFNLQTAFSRNGLCNGMKNKHARPRWQPRGPTVPMVVGSSNNEAQVGVSVFFFFGGGGGGWYGFILKSTWVPPEQGLH
ncbi:hypothetical protein D8674_040764 [Pyrus ussuriensis x Pyrus communis]|uniref:Uncharacterized protein n=1 Tax=Pyrus ussuriensis x Pyrus communis TaxID=2448454 RepID=A0A5N5GGZ5_9ROSA|nr:hypothetical protein D8674_040764 [Pyrus ussuriensis x Pyrus communis]